MDTEKPDPALEVWSTEDLLNEVLLRFFAERQAKTWTTGKNIAMNLVADALSTIKAECGQTGTGSVDYTFKY